MIFVLISLAFISCSEQKKNNVLHVYTPFDANEAAYYIEQFEKKTGINVEWVRLSTGEVLARIEAEKNNPQASVWFAGPSPEFMTAKKKGLLQPYQPKLEFELDPKYRDSEWFWTGFYFGAIGFASNSNFFTSSNIPLPKSWQDLLSPSLTGKISMAYPATSGTAYTIVSSLLQLMGEDKGWEYLKLLDKQIHHYNKSGAACVTQAGLGEIAVGIAFTTDIFQRGKGAGYQVELSFPQEGTGYEIGGVALIKGTKESELGKQFIDYLLSVDGQNEFAKFQRMPLHSKAKISEQAVQPSHLHLINYDGVQAANVQADMISKWKTVVSR